jgi:hypothetical protein
MKKNMTVIKGQPDTIRAGVISALILTIFYLYLTGLSNLPRAWSFIVLFAVCLVLMVKSLADLLVWTFALVARYSGAGLGHSVRLLRRFC